MGVEGNECGGFQECNGQRDVTKQYQKNCNFKHSCTWRAEVESDPCIGIDKYTYITWACVDSPTEGGEEEVIIPGPEISTKLALIDCDETCNSLCEGGLCDFFPDQCQSACHSICDAIPFTDDQEANTAETSVDVELMSISDKCKCVCDKLCGTLGFPLEYACKGVCYLCKVIDEEETGTIPGTGAVVPLNDKETVGKICENENQGATPLERGLIDCGLQKISISSAVYGRVVEGNECGGFQECNGQRDVTKQYQKNCNFKHSCTWRAEVESDPCIGIDKYTYITFTCVDSPTEGGEEVVISGPEISSAVVLLNDKETVGKICENENQGATPLERGLIDCGLQKISISSAVYGRVVEGN